MFVDSLATFAEHQPDSRKIDFNGFTMQAMFEEGKQLHGEDFCSLATFYRLMDEDFPDVRLPGKSRFSVCDVCTLPPQREIRESSILSFATLTYFRR